MIPAIILLLSLSWFAVGTHRSHPLLEACRAIAATTPPPPVNDQSMRYHACCGLGHRLGRTAYSYLQAMARNTTMLLDWGTCLEGTSLQPIPIAEALFDLDRQRHGMTSMDLSQTYQYKVSNEETGFRHWMHSEAFATSPDVAQWVCHLVTSMHEPWYTDWLDEWDRWQALTPPLPILGLHVRHGNGETGDFVHKGRHNFALLDVLNHTLVTLDEVARQLNLDNYRIFLATDSGVVVDQLRELTPHDILVHEQRRAPPGAGIAFGAAGSACSSPQAQRTNPACRHQSCLQSFADMWIDMLHLSSCQGVVASRYSSFLQVPQLWMRARQQPFCMVHEKSLKKPHPCTCTCNPAFLASPHIYARESACPGRREVGSICQAGHGKPFQF